MQGGAAALAQYVIFTECHILHGLRGTCWRNGVSREQYAAHLPTQQRAARHLASGCCKTWKPAFLQDVTFTKRRQNDSNAVPVHAVQVSVVYNCKMWYLLSYVARKTPSHRAECGIWDCSYYYTFGVFWSFLWFINFSMSSQQHPLHPCAKVVFFSPFIFFLERGVGLC